MYELQVIETRLESERAALHAVEQRLAWSPEIDRLRAEHRRLAAEIESCRASLRRVEREAEDAGEKAKKLNATLYGGMIHDSREMALMQAEIGHAESRKSTLEDEEIELMERLEHLEAQAREKSGALDELTEKRATGLAELRAERDRRAGSVAELETERDAAFGRLDPPRQVMFTRLRDRTGHAVSVVESGVCQWCRVQIPPQDVQHARGERLVTCNNCGRVLYAD